MSVNKVILVGNAGKDAEVRYIDNGAAVATFSLATSETYTAKNGEKVTTTEWHNIVAWRGLGEMAGKYIKKGSQLYIEGRLRSRSYDDKDGIKRYVTEVSADIIQLLGRKAGADEPNHAPNSDYQKPDSSAANGPADIDASSDPSDDLPF